MPPPARLVTGVGLQLAMAEVGSLIAAGVIGLGSPARTGARIGSSRFSTRSGTCQISRIRATAGGARNAHFGVQATEIFGSETDPLGDGVVDESTVGEVTAETVFLMSLPVPRRATDEELELMGISKASVSRGRSLFTRVEGRKSLGCGSCHVPFHLLESTTFLVRNPSTDLVLPIRVSHHIANRFEVEMALSSRDAFLALSRRSKDDVSNFLRTQLIQGRLGEGSGAVPPPRPSHRDGLVDECSALLESVAIEAETTAEADAIRQELTDALASASELLLLQDLDGAMEHLIAFYEAVDVQTPRFQSGDSGRLLEDGYEVMECVNRASDPLRGPVAAAGIPLAAAGRSRSAPDPRAGAPRFDLKYRKTLGKSVIDRDAAKPPESPTTDHQGGARREPDGLPRRQSPEPAPGG